MPPGIGKVKRSRGRPKKNLPIRASGKKDKKCIKKVSANEGLKGRRAVQLTTGHPVESSRTTRSKEPKVGLRRSPRHNPETAVT